MKRALCLAIFTAFLLLFEAVHTADVQAQEKVLKIGVMAPLTGPVSTAGLPHLRCTELAAEWINKRGGITVKGEKYKIELVVEDEKDTTDTAVTAATKLVELHKVRFIVGTISPTLLVAVGSITEKAKVLRSAWHGEGAPIEINKDTPYTFRVPVVPKDFAPALMKYQVQHYPKEKKVAFLYIENPAAPLLAEHTKRVAESTGLSVVSVEMYPVTTRDFYPVISKVLGSKPEVIYCTALPHHMASILKSSRELGFSGPILNLSPTSPEVVRNIAGKAFADNCIVPAPDVSNPQMTPLIKEIREMCLKKFGEVHSEYVRAWDSLWWMVQAIEKAQSLDPTVVAKTWEKMDRLEASTGWGKMGGKISYGINHIGVLPFAVTRMSKGELEHVGWLMPEIP